MGEEVSGYIGRALVRHQVVTPRDHASWVGQHHAKEGASGVAGPRSPKSKNNR